MAKRIFVILMVVSVYCVIMSPIERFIKNHCHKKWIYYILTLLIGIVILLILYGIADLCGYGLSRIY